MSIIVDEHDDKVDLIVTNAASVGADLHAGLQDTEKAVESARAARRKRWICFWIIIAVLVIVGIVVGVTVAQQVANRPR